MRWSQLKIRMESFFADSVKGRVELRVTRYHKAPDDAGRGWITIDKNEVYGCSDMGFEYLWGVEEQRRINKPAGIQDYELYRTPEYRIAVNSARNDLESCGIISRWDFVHTIECYLNTPIERILASENVVARALSMLDRRVGKARLAKMSMDGQPQIVRQLYEVRCRAEGLQNSV